MPSDLVLDIGNSRMKAALFSGDVIAARWVADDISYDEMAGIFMEYPGIKRAIISSTREKMTPAERWLGDNMVKVIHFDHAVHTPLKNLYDTPATLGADRLAAAVGAQKLYPGRNIMVADFGTALTVDIVTAAGEFLGGTSLRGFRPGSAS